MNFLSSLHQARMGPHARSLRLVCIVPCTNASTRETPKISKILLWRNLYGGVLSQLVSLLHVELDPSILLGRLRHLHLIRGVRCPSRLRLQLKLLRRQLPRKLGSRRQREFKSTILSCLLWRLFSQRKPSSISGTEKFRSFGTMVSSTPIYSNRSTPIISIG